MTTATEALTFQAAAGGLALGVGPSHAWYVQGQLGRPYTSPLRHTREYLSALRSLLRGEHVRFSGEFFTVDTGLSVSAPAPGLLLSALGPRMPEVAHDRTAERGPRPGQDAPRRGAGRGRRSRTR